MEAFMTYIQLALCKYICSRICQIKKTPFN